MTNNHTYLHLGRFIRWSISLQCSLEPFVIGCVSSR